MPTIVSTLVPQTLEELRTDLRLLVGDIESLSTSFTDSTMNQALNFAVQHYLRITGKSYVENTASLTSGVWVSGIDCGCFNNRFSDSVVCWCVFVCYIYVCSGQDRDWETP